MPANQRDPIDTIVKLELDGPAADIPVIKPVEKSGSLAFAKAATASNYYQNSAEYSPDKAFDDDYETRWGCDWGTHSCWLEVDLGEPKTFRRAVLANRTAACKSSNCRSLRTSSGRPSTAARRSANAAHWSFLRRPANACG